MVEPESADDKRGHERTGLLKLGGLAVALGVGTWLASVFLLPARLPDDFPKLPDVQALNPGLRTLLVSADKEARRHPGSAEAVGRLGMAYHANQYFAEAGSAYRIAARLAPGDYQWAYCQAFLNEETGDENGQLDSLRQTLRLKPDHVPAMLKLADGYFKQDKLDEAAHYYEIAARSTDSGSFVQATLGLGRIAARREEWNKVVEYAAPIARSYPLARPPYQLLQQAYEALGQADKAAEVGRSMQLGNLLALAPIKDPLNDQLIDLCYSSTRLLKEAGVLSRFGEPDRAIQAARRAAEADPRDADARHFVAYTLLTFHADEPDSVNDALAQLREGLRLKPGDLAPLWKFSALFFKAPKTAAPVEQLRALLDANANHAEARVYLGRAADQQGKTEEAVAQYQTALRNNPNNAEACNQLGLISTRAGRFDEAITYLQKSVQLDPACAACRFNLGVALVLRGRDSQAREEFAQVLRLTPNDVPTHVYMGVALLEANRADEAAAQFREALRFKADDPEAHYGLGCAFSMQRKREEALGEIREALRLRPDYPAAQKMLQRLGAN